MKSEKLQTPEDARRNLRDASLRLRFADELVPGLPVDADAPRVRVPAPRLGGLLPAIVQEWLAERNPFYDRVCADWEKLFPDLPARPGRWQTGEARPGARVQPPGKLFLYVRSSSLLFALRAKLPRVKKVLAALPDAPARFTVHLEIHATEAVKGGRCQTPSGVWP